MSDNQSDWTIVRMRKLLAMEHCPRCGLLPAEHDDTTCEMRYYSKGENNDSTNGNHQEEQGLLQEELQSA
jgi:ribosomal protein S27AE